MSKDDSLQETTFSIPYNGDDVINPSLPSSREDFPESHELRFEAYTRAWTKCLDRIQSIVQQLLEPHVEAVAKQVQDRSTVPGLPHPELPVISISNPVFGASFLTDVCDRIDAPSTHLYPSDCTSLTAAMRSLVSGLVQEIEDVDQVQRKATMSLANFDINYLSAWYKAYAPRQETSSTLLVVLHNFEEFDPAVMQDVFYICSQHLTELPLSFILSMSTPLPTYLHIVYPRATLSYLRIRDVTIPSGLSVLNEILLRTFFSTTFDPDIIIGPKALLYISDYFTRHVQTLDSLITNLQLLYMKHFSLEPLSSLVYTTPLSLSQSQPLSAALLELALTKILSVDESILENAQGPAVVEKVIEAIDKSRARVRQQYKRIRIAFNLTRLIQLFLVGEAYRGLNWNLEKDLCGIFINYLNNDVERDSKQLNMIVKKLQIDQLCRLLQQIQDFLTPTNSKDEEVVDTRVELEGVKEVLEDANLSVEDGAHVAKKFAQWVDTWTRTLLGRLETIPLWEIWYTGLTPFPSELINPSIRASILSGLLRPLEFTSAPTDMAIGSDDDSLWKLPDTSILFKRYLDSGKMINVYDWFESFQAVLETQREELNKIAAAKQGRKSPKKRSPKKQSTKAKGKERQTGEVDVVVMGGGGEDDEEKWKLEVQARFVRALHELDYLGFIKHTKRRADHVVRTVFDINE